jgi:fucose permease
MDFWKTIPEIIHQAAGSQLGLLALMIIGLAILAVFFFRRADVKVQLSLFIMLFLGVVAFGVAVLKVPSNELVASIWKVESGEKSTELATKEFSFGAGQPVPAATVKQFAEWVSNELKLTAHAVPVHIEVEKFEGRGKITERVGNELKSNPLIQIVDAKSRGIDYIISGSVKRSNTVKPQ